MIRESLYFSFAGRPSTDFNIINVSLGDGLYEEPLMGSRTVREVKVQGNPKPYLIEVEQERLSFPVRFYFEEGFNNELIRDVVKWLNVDSYEELWFSSNPDKVFYAMPVEEANLIHNGLKEGYIELNFSCDSPYRYSPVKSTGWIDISHSDCQNRCDKIDLDVRRYIEIDSLGDFEVKPVIHIKKVKNGEIKVENLNVKNQMLTVKNLKDQEEITIHCEKEYIQTNLENTWRYNDFNDVFISIPYGKKKEIKVYGRCFVKIDYEYTYKA